MRRRIEKASCLPAGADVAIVIVLVSVVDKPSGAHNKASGSKATVRRLCPRSRASHRYKRVPF